MEPITTNENQSSNQYLYYAEEHYENNNRFNEFLIDFAICYVLYIVITSLIWLEDGFAFFLFLCCNLAFGVVYFLYYFIMESIWGKTIGKFIFKMKVVDHNGNKPSVKSIAWRSFVRLFPFEPLSYLNGKKKGGWREDHRFYKRWHEGLSNAYTVSDSN